MGKGEIACLLFPQFFLTVWRTFYNFHSIQNCRLQTLNFESLKFVVWERVKVVFHRIENTVTSIFFFSHNVFKRLFSFQSVKSRHCVVNKPWPAFPETFFVFFSRFCKFECNGLANQKLLHSDGFRYRKIWRTRLKKFFRLLKALKDKAFVNIIGKGENVGYYNVVFPPFPKVFSKFPFSGSLLYRTLVKYTLNKCIILQF